MIGVMALLLACRPPALPDPEVIAVQPERVWNGEDQAVVVLGANFFSQIEVDARGLGVDYDRDWLAWLVPESGGKRTPLAGVSVEDTEHVRAVVEAGLPAGRYRIELEGPTGRAATSTPLLTVADTLEVGFAVRYADPPAAYVAGDSVSLIVEAVGQDGQRVFNDVPVLVSLEGAPTTVRSAIAFDDVVMLPEGVGFQAVLPDGGAEMSIGLVAPGRLDVVARSPVGADALQTGSLTLVVGGGEGLPATIAVPPAILANGAVAGEPFDVLVSVFDERGDPVEEPLDVRLRNACGGLVADAVVRGATPVRVTVTEATARNGCVEDRIEVAAGARGASAPFQVVGAEATALELFALEQELVAGVADLVVVVLPRDAYGNAADLDGELAVTDSIGTFTDVGCERAPQIFLCSGTPTAAGADIEVFASGVGAEGALGGYIVRPSPTIGSVTVSVVGAVAGAPFEVVVHTVDPFGNPHEAGQVDPSQLSLADERGDLACEPPSAAADGSLTSRCTLTVARDGATLTAEIAGIEGGAVFDVVNGPLATVALVVPPLVVAGDGFLFDLVGADAFGNPYIEQTAPFVDLSSTLGSLVPAGTLLGPDGKARVFGSLTEAGVHTLVATQLDVVLGASSPVTVVAAPTEALSVTVSAPWGWVGRSTPVEIESVDAYGNRTSTSGTVALTSREGATSAVSSNMVNGLAVADVLWTDTAIDEVLDASLAEFVGASAPLYVVRDCAVDPTLVVTFAGVEAAVACYSPLQGSATATGDFGGSTPTAGKALVGYALALGDAVVDSGAPSVTIEAPAIGVGSLSALIVQNDACASERSVPLYVGLDDGSATGPLHLAASATDIGSDDLVDIALSGATDCAGDPAASARVRVRATVGEILGAAPSGQGLEITLDAAGDAAFQLATDARVGGGAAELVAWSPAGSAVGALTLAVADDTIRPTVRSFSPSGAATEPVDTLEFEFSEPLLATSLTPDRLTIAGPTPATAQSALVYDGDTRATVTLSAPVDPTLGAYIVTLGADVRDAGGNRLSGDWSGERADFFGSFGPSAAAVPPVSCLGLTPAEGRFRPDGDDGVGAEADQVAVTLSSATAPSWWVAEVRDAADALRRQAWVVPLGALDSWAWDGRDDAGVVVEAGTYTLDVTPQDAAGNRGPGCIALVAVEHAAGGTP